MSTTHTNGTIAHNITNNRLAIQQIVGKLAFDRDLGVGYVQKLGAWDTPTGPCESPTTAGAVIATARFGRHGKVHFVARHGKVHFVVLVGHRTRAAGTFGIGGEISKATKGLKAGILKSAAK